MPKPPTKIDLSKEVIVTLASDRARGKSLRDLEETYGFSRPVINRALRTDLAKGVQQGIADEIVRSTVIVIKTALSGMSDLALNALRHNLEQMKMDAVKEYFNLVGVRSEESNKGKGGQNNVIQVILPGAARDESKEVISDVQEG